MINRGYIDAFGLEARLAWAEAERDTLQAENAGLRDALSHANHMQRVTQDDRNALEKECELLREALKPFGSSERLIDFHTGAAVPDEGCFITGTAWTERGSRRTLSESDFRRARAALNKEGG
jgi:hypothetical protein